MTALRNARSILIAGCGGGFDVYSGLPLHAHLTGLGKTAHLANLSFANLERSGCRCIDGKAWIIDGKARELPYFPERHLVEWFARRGRIQSVTAFPRTGVRRLHDAYRETVKRLNIDAVVLVDGGTDSIMKGDEPDLGTIVEDATSIAAVNELDVPVKLLACLGFGVDHFHGVSHHSFLENTAELIKLSGFLGCSSLTADMPEAQAFLDAVDYANERQPAHKSIVCNSVASAIRGEFGDCQTTGRTASSELFVNPLMALYWFYDVGVVSSWMKFYDDILYTNTVHEVWTAIQDRRELLRIRPRRPIPL
jgi:hypothetical protein